MAALPKRWKILSFIRLFIFSLIIIPTRGLSEENIIANNETETDSPRKYFREPRIINGSPVASSDEYPYYTRIRMKGYPGTLHCGGSLIGPDVVLSSAHCFRPAEYFIVGVNSFMHKSGGSEIERKCVKIVVHPKYNSKTFENDVMILFLDSPVYSIHPVQLNTHPYLPFPGNQVIAMGLGSKHPEVYRPAEGLMETRLGTLDYWFCNDKDRYNGRVYPETMFCAGFQQGNGFVRDTCFGDSGGPVLAASTEEQVGIVSWGVGCAKTQYPGVYVKVGNFYEWIEETACRFSRARSGGHLSCHKLEYQDPLDRNNISKDASDRRNRFGKPSRDMHSKRRKKLRSDLQTRPDDIQNEDYVQNEDYGRCEEARGRQVQYFLDDGFQSELKQIHTSDCHVLDKSACFEDDLVSQEPIWRICSLRCRFLSHCLREPTEIHDAHAVRSDINGRGRKNRQDQD
mmetsp:Transcript_22151/g.30838  ORF Transcript_22151/g.30838 Transcript_22151/m.30838 type:complete len:456 (+) Transcript_22151:89-1456(+)